MQYMYTILDPIDYMNLKEKQSSKTPEK